MDDILKASKSSANGDENASKRNILTDKGSTRDREGSSYWKQIVKNYEERNATLEKRRNALAERIHFMECALPSLLAGAAVAAANKKQHGSEKEARTIFQNTPLGR